MSIFLKKIQRVNPQDKQGPKKWYASQVTTEQMDETAVAESEPAETAEALTAKNVKRVKINFRPGSEIKESLAKATFIWTGDMAGEIPAEDGGSPGEV